MEVGFGSVSSQGTLGDSKNCANHSWPFARAAFPTLGFLFKNYMNHTDCTRVCSLTRTSQQVHRKESKKSCLNSSPCLALLGAPPRKCGAVAYTLFPKCKLGKGPQACRHPSKPPPYPEWRTSSLTAYVPHMQPLSAARILPAPTCLSQNPGCFLGGTYFDFTF